MLDPAGILQAAGVAAGLAIVAALLTCMPKGQPRRQLASAGGAVGVGAGLLAGAWTLHLAPHYPPGEDRDRFLLLLLPAATLVEMMAGLNGRTAWALRAAVAVVAAPVLLHGSSYLTDAAGPGTRDWPPALALQILAGLAVTLFAGWAALSRLAERVPGASVPLVLACVCAGSGVVVMLSGYASGGQLGFPLAGGLAGVAVVAALAGRTNPRGAVGVGMVGLFALIVTARFFAGLTTATATLLSPLRFSPGCRSFRGSAGSARGLAGVCDSSSWQSLWELPCRSPGISSSPISPDLPRRNATRLSPRSKITSTSGSDPGNRV